MIIGEESEKASDSHDNWLKGVASYLNGSEPFGLPYSFKCFCIPKNLPRWPINTVDVFVSKQTEW